MKRTNSSRIARITVASIGAGALLVGGGLVAAGCGDGGTPTTGTTQVIGSTDSNGVVILTPEEASTITACGGPGEVDCTKAVPPARQYSARDDRITATTGGQFTISLGMGRNTRMQWHVTHGGRLVKLPDPAGWVTNENPDRVPMDGGYVPKPGGPYVQHLDFTATTPGHGALLLRQYNPATGPSSSDATVTFDLTVTG